MTPSGGPLAEEYGPWALVTGASSGIGKAFAHRVAAGGLNVALVARGSEGLEAVAGELAGTHGVAVRTVPADLSSPDGARQVVAATADLDLGLVVSNAGSGAPGSFVRQDLAEQLRVVQLNAVTPVALAHHFGDAMVRRGGGGILFVGSTFGYQGTPFAAIYAATKAFTLVFAESLHFELREHGVDVLVVSPGPTRTPAKDRFDVDFSQLHLQWLEPEEVVDVGFAHLGRRASVVAGAVNNLISLFAGSLTREAMSQLIGRLAERALPEESS